jgi:2-polyprenyl-3-methyl-5-hydroxy-6-metoxy-1,4-benzoquinol methylase
MPQSAVGTGTFAAIPITKVAEYWDARPCNVAHSAKPVGTREYFDEVETRKYLVEPHIPKFAEFDRWRDARVLEIGCGIGTDTMNFARHGARVTAVDISARSVEIAKRRAEVYGLQDRMSFYVGNAEELSDVVPVEAYDLVYSFGVLHHTLRPDRAVEQIRRYVRPGSTLKVMVYHRRSWKTLSILLGHGHGRFWARDAILAKYSEAQTGCPVTYTYLPHDIPMLLNGFRIQRVRIEHIFPYRVEDYVQYRYRKVWYFQIIPAPVFRWLERHFGWHLCVTAEC